MLNFVQIYGFDMTPAGELGLGTINRLRAGVKQHQKTGCFLVLSAHKSPLHLDVQPKSLAELMQDWLLGAGVAADSIEVLNANTFNSDGEAAAFGGFRALGKKGHCSSWWHIPRIWRLSRLYWNAGEKHYFVPVWDLPKPRVLALEIGKNIAMFFPLSWQIKLKNLAKKATGQTTSY